MNSLEDMLTQFEKTKFFMRIDEEVTPTGFKCSTVNASELMLLRKVTNVIRRGRIESLQTDKIIFENKG